MADFEFFCPSCNQRIQCDELWAGHQLQCPSCQQTISVPHPQSAAAPASTRGSNRSLVPPPPPSAQPRLSIGRGQTADSPEAASKPKPVYREFKADQSHKKGRVTKWVTTGVVLIALGAGAYFGWPLLRDYQDKVNAKRRAAEKNADGGELGHIANVYQTLDATDPDRDEKTGRARSGVPRQPRAASGKPMPGGAGEVADAGAAAPEKELPVLPAVWSLDVATAKIPEGRANGSISGTNFVVEAARLSVVGGSPVLSLRQGAAASPDREFLIYLRLKAGESLTGHVWTVSQDMKGAGVPQVAKRWKTNPRFAATQKSFSTGYAMKLELGQADESGIAGKIFLSLPDPEKSVVAGVFKAATSVINPAATPATPIAAPAPKSASPLDPATAARYGIKR